MKTYTIIYGSTVETHITSLLTVKCRAYDIANTLKRTVKIYTDGDGIQDNLLDIVKPAMPKKQDSLKKERKAHRDNKKATKQELSELEKDLKKALAEKMLLWR